MMMEDKLSEGKASSVPGRTIRRCAAPPVSIGLAKRLDRD